MSASNKKYDTNGRFQLAIPPVLATGNYPARRKYEIDTVYRRESDGFAQDALCKKIRATSNDRV
jgi:hypothetical protein